LRLGSLAGDGEHALVTGFARPLGFQLGCERLQFRVQTLAPDSFLIEREALRGVIQLHQDVAGINRAAQF